MNSLSSLHQSLSEDITMWHQLGVRQVGLISPKLAAAGWEAAVALVSESGLRVSNISTENTVIAESLRFAAAVGAGTVYVCSGPATDRTWEESATSFCKDIAPLAALADELGVRLAVEPTNPLRTDVSFVHSLRDAIDLARDAGISVVVDFYSCWYERDFDKLIESHVDAVALVQICDYVMGTFDTPNRAVPGDGDIPLRRLLSTVIEAGYQGPFDLEILGPRIEAETYPPALRRSLERIGDILADIGVRE